MLERLLVVHFETASTSTVQATPAVTVKDLQPESTPTLAVNLDVVTRHPGTAVWSFSSRA